MTNQHSNSKDEVHSNPKNAPDRIIYPDAIIDAREQPTAEGTHHRESAQSNRQTEPKSARQPQTLSLRLLCLSGFLICSLFVGGLILLIIIMGLFAALCLLQNQSLNQSLFRLWRLCIKAIVAAGGFAIGLISPIMGLGLLALFFSLPSRQGGESFFHHLFHKIFK